MYCWSLAWRILSITLLACEMSLLEALNFLKARVGWSERTALKHYHVCTLSCNVHKHVHYQVWNRSLVQVGCMRQVLGAGALGRPRGMGWGGRREGGSGWGTHVNPGFIHVNVWQKPLQYCKVISLQLIKINEKKKKKKTRSIQLPKSVGLDQQSQLNHLRNDSDTNAWCCSWRFRFNTGWNTNIDKYF